MRGFVGRFVAAATMGALAAPVLADAPAYEEYEDLNNAAAYFNVNLNQDTTELIRLDVTNTDTPCDITTLSINNQPLPLGPYQHGRGPLSLPSGSTIEALWTITCVTQDQDGQLQFNPSNISPVHDGQFANMRPGMWVVVDILEVDGEKTHAGFEANFIQGGDYVRWHFADVYEAGGAQGAEPELVTYFGGEVDWVVPWDEESVNEASQELKWLRTGAWGDDDVEDEAAVGLGWYPSLHELQDLKHSAAFFIIDLGLYDEEERHTLRLDVGNSDRICDPTGKLFIAKKPLIAPMADDFVNAETKTFFRLPSGPKIQASWTVGCVAEGSDPDVPVYDHGPDSGPVLQPGLHLQFKILTVDGVDVSYRNLGFDVNFAQGEDGVVWHSASPKFSGTRTYFFTKTGTDTGIGTYWDPELAKQVDDDALTVLADFIPVKSEEEDSEEEQPLDEPSESEKDKCTDFRCLMDQMRESMTIEEFKEIDAQAEELVREAIANYNKKQKPLTSTQTQDDEDDVVFIVNESEEMKPITAVEDASILPDVPIATPTSLFLASLPPQDQDLLLTLLFAGTAFILFTIVSLFIFKSRPEPSIQRLPLHRETPEERLARVANRRHACKAFLSRIFCGLFSFDEKTSEAPQGRDCRAAQQQDEEGTMEQEISRFREAADMVESMIHAEEGRSAPEMRSVASAAPPSYESDRADGSAVVDGFRYMRVSDGAWGEGENEGSSDRLGYGDK